MVQAQPGYPRVMSEAFTDNSFHLRPSIDVWELPELEVLDYFDQGRNIYFFPPF